MRHHHGLDGNESDGSVDSCEFSNDSDDSICRCDTQSSLTASNCKIGLACSREDHNDRFADNAYSPSGSGKLLQTKDSLEKVNANLRNKGISSGGSDTRKCRKDECARDRKVKNGWLGVDVRGQVKNTIQEYHCTKKDGASTYTCVIVKKIDLPKSSLKGEESKGSKDCSYNMKGNEALARPQETTPSTAVPTSKKPPKKEFLETSASNSERSKKDLCSKCSMQTACSQHTTNTQQSPVVTKSSVCSRGSLCSKNSVCSERSSEKEKSTVASKSYFSWVSSALKNTRDDIANKSKSSIPPTDSQTGKPEYSKRSSVSVCKSDSIKSICITESKIVTAVVKDVPVQEKSSQTDFKITKTTNSNLMPGDSKPNLCLHEAQSNVLGKTPKSDFGPSLKLKASKPPETKAYVPPSCSKTTIQTSLASCFSRTSSKPNIAARTPKSKSPPANSKTCLKRTSSKDSGRLKSEKNKSGTNSLGAKNSKIGFCTDSFGKSTKRSVADKASQTDVTKRTKKNVQECKKACELKGSEESLGSQNSGHTTTLVFKPAPKSSSSKKSVCSLKSSKSKDKTRRSKNKATKKSSVCSKKSAKSLRAESRKDLGEMNGPSCSLSCKDSFMAAKNDPEIARTSCSIKSCDAKSKSDDDSSINFEDCLCEDATCDVTMRPSSCRPKKGFLKKLFCRKTREEQCMQQRETRKKQRQKRKEKERKRREKERERERREREKERERERKEREKECKRRRKEREKEKKKREKAREQERKALEKEREKERKNQEKAKKEEEKRKVAEACRASSSSSDSLSC